MESGVTLTIKPGVQVIFNGLYKIVVNGNITAKGIATDMILFTSNQPTPSMQQWNRIEVGSQGHAEISFCNISCATTGLYLGSSFNNVTNNIFWSNYWGLELSTSHNNNVSENNVSNNNYGIRLYNFRYSNFTKNNVSSNYYNGFYLWDSSNENTSVQNNIFYNKRGLYLWDSSKQNITDNDFTYNGIVISGSGLASHNIPRDNLVNGKPLFYHKNENNLTIDGIPIGQLILAGCMDMLLQNLEINKTDSALQIYSSRNGTVRNSDISWNNYNGIAIFSSSEVNIKSNNVLGNDDYGIHLRSSGNNIIGNNVSFKERTGIRLFTANNNNITQNKIIQNEWDGIFIDSSDHNNVTHNMISANVMGGLGLDQSTYHKTSNQNLVYHNNFLNNSNQAIDGEDDDSWDFGYLIGGNYWSDYGGFDYFRGPKQNIPGGDEIGDNPYVIDADSRDNYPLLGPSNFTTLENYTVLKQGWNLISIPLIQEEENLTRVLGNINGWYDAVQYYDVLDGLDPWKHNKVGKPNGNDLFKLNESLGFWVHITNPRDTIFIYNGTQPLVNQVITLFPGWNMVGYPSETVYNRTDGLNTIDFGLEVDIIKWFDASLQSWQRMDSDD